MKAIRCTAAALMMLWLIAVVFASNGPQVSARSSQAAAGTATDGPKSRAAITAMNRELASQVVQTVQARGQAPATGQRKPLMADDVFKNIQVLKGLTVDEFMGTMGIMANSLAFCCNDCHAGAGTATVAWEKDDKPNKVMARKMVTMMQALNKENFSGRQVVTCWTCHRGREFPVVTESLDRVYGDVESELDDIFTMPVAGAPSVDEILNKYYQAVGGAAKLAGITSFIAKGTGQGFFGIGGSAPIEIFAKSPNQRATYIHFPDADRGDAARTFDGRTGWLSTPLAIVKKYELAGGELDGARIDAQLSFPERIKQSLIALRVGAETTVNDHQFWVVQGNGQRGAFASLYFDKESGLLTRVVRYTPSAVGRVGTQIDYSDYRDVGTSGIKMPYGITFSWLDGKDTMKLTDIQLNVAIDPAKFGEPNALASAR